MKGIFKHLVAGILLLSVCNGVLSQDVAVCGSKMLECTTNALTVAGITVDKVSEISNDKTVFCKYAKSLLDCYKPIEDTCTNVESFQIARDFTQQGFDQLKCGCASTIASMALVFASFALIFLHKSDL